MQRLYYLSKTLSDAENVTTDLLNHGIFKGQLHLVAKNDAELERHQLPTASPLETTDLLPAGESGLLIGLVIGIGACTLLYASNLGAETPLLVYLGVFILCTGFFTWLGGFVGLGLKHYKLSSFQPALEQGNILLMIDTSTAASHTVEQLMSHHPDAVPAGRGSTWNNPLHPHHL